MSEDRPVVKLVLSANDSTSITKKIGTKLKTEHEVVTESSAQNC